MRSVLFQLSRSCLCLTAGAVLLGQSPNGDATSQIARGRAFAEKKDFRAALPLLDEAVQSAPQDAEARRWRAHCRTALGRYEGALEDLDIAVALAPDIAWAWYARGMAQHHLGRNQAAIADYTKALELDPTHFKAVEWRGFNHARLGDHLSAWADFSRAVELDPGNPWVFHARARAALALGAIEHAARDLRVVLALDAKDAEAHAQLGFLLVAQGDYDGALRHFDRAIELAPGDHDYARLWLHWLRAMRGQAPEEGGPAPDLPDRGWPGELGKALSGALSRDELLLAADKAPAGEVAARRCEAWFYLGLGALLAGKRDEARDCLHEVLVHGEPAMPEWRAARRLAQR